MKVFGMEVTPYEKIKTPTSFKKVFGDSFPIPFALFWQSWYAG